MRVLDMNYVNILKLFRLRYKRFGDGVGGVDCGEGVGDFLGVRVGEVNGVLFWFGVFMVFMYVKIDSFKFIFVKFDFCNEDFFVVDFFSIEMKRIIRYIVIFIGMFRVWGVVEIMLINLFEMYWKFDEILRKRFSGCRLDI